LVVQVQDVMLAIHTLWGAPVLIVVIIGLLYQQLGWATFVGLVVVAIYSPISSECLWLTVPGWVDD
jgi:ATP-binding cassette subfamily C (CFTR/MRP) protein 1